ncbi:hypothetical protein Tco_1237159, partial [Tanacetum coccineum]
DNVKMLLEGSELTKEDRESQLYDDFEHFRQNKERQKSLRLTICETNNGLKDFNTLFKLLTYLKQHEAHANENKMMLERLTQQTVDPLALMSNVSPQHYHSQSSTNPPTTLLIITHSAGLPHNLILGISSNENLNRRTITQHTMVEEPMDWCNNAAGVAASLVMVESTEQSGLKVEWVVLDEEQLLFLAGGQDNAIDEDVDEQPRIQYVNQFVKAELATYKEQVCELYERRADIVKMKDEDLKEQKITRPNQRSVKCKLHFKEKKSHPKVKWKSSPIRGQVKQFATVASGSQPWEHSQET